MLERFTPIRQETQGILLAFLAGIVIGAEGITAKLAYAGGANILSTLAIRFLIAALFFWGMLFPQIKLQKTKKTIRRWAIILALSGQGTTVLLLFYSFQFIPAAVTMLFFYIYPAIVTFLAAIFLGEKLTKKKIGALILTFIGLTVILGLPGAHLDIKGVIAALIGALTNGCYLVGQTRLLRDMEPKVYNAYATLSMGLAFLLLALFSGGFSLDFNFQAWIAIAVMALVCTVIAYAAIAWGLMLIGASRVAIISTIEPLVTAILGYFILDEILQLGQMLGGAIILTGIIWLQVSEKNPQLILKKQAGE